MFFVVDAGYVLAMYLVEHPDTVVRKWERGAFTFYHFNRDNGNIMYSRPSNKCHSDWYVASGLMCYLKNGDFRKEYFL